MAAAVDISIFGDKKLERMLKKLPDAAQKRAVRPALKRAAKRVHALSLARVPVDTGALKAAVAAQSKPRLIRSRSAIIYVLDLPKRELLGINPASKWYYPAFVEYGFTHASGKHVPAQSYLRAPVDENTDQLHGMMRHDINKGIVKEAARLGRKK